MSQSANPPAGVSSAAGSERFRLARLARDAALSIPGVAGTDAGPMGLFVSAGGGERLEGVICAASKDGGYDVTLQLICRLVPLVALGEQVEKAITHAGAGAGIPVASVNVTVTELIDPEET